MDREKQFEKTIEDIENIKCLALYLLEAVRYGEDPDAELTLILLGLLVVRLENLRTQY